MISVFYVSAAAGAGYTCPTYKEYVSCNPGYVLNGTGPGNECVPAPTCDAGYYLTDAGECEICPAGYACVGDNSRTPCMGRNKYSTPGAAECSTAINFYYTIGCDNDGNKCTGQEQCRGATYCTDGVQYQCPAATTHKRTTFPENYYNPVIIHTGNVDSSKYPTRPSDCSALSQIKSDRGTFLEYLSYNEETEQFDNVTKIAWYEVAPGYYLSDTWSCGMYAYYNAISECKPGYYCPGNEKVVCNVENKADVHTKTFGIIPCPAGTYSDAGAAECTVCPAGTWSDGAATTCTPCPDGYSNSEDAAGGHVDITSCVAECAAGYYVPSPGEPCTEITGSVPYYTAAHTVAYGDTSGDNYKKCPAPAPNSPGGYIFIPNTIANSHTNIKYCLRNPVPMRYTYNPDTQYCENGICAPKQTTHGILENPCYYTSGDDGNAIYDDNRPNDRWGCVGGATLLSCDAGFWAPVSHISGSGHFLSCQPVGTDYWSPDGDLARYPCPDGTMTIGYGVGAANVNDCVPYKNLHIGDMTLQMSSTKYTTPALHIQLPDGNKYYGYMISGARDGTLNIGLPGGQYGVINPLDQFEHALAPGWGVASGFDIIVIP